MTGPARRSPPDRRADRRHTPVLLIGRLCGAAQAACVVHDIARGGLMARFVDPPRPGQSVCIELRGLPPIHGTVRWVDGCKAGIAFDAPQPFERVFRGRGEDGTIARPPRFPLDAPARLRLGGAGIDVSVIDISAGGMKLTAVPESAPGCTGQVMLPETGTAIFDTICWTVGGRMGFRFVTQLPLETLSVVLAQARQRLPATIAQAVR